MLRRLVLSASFLVSLISTGPCLAQDAVTLVRKLHPGQELSYAFHRDLKVSQTPSGAAEGDQPAAAESSIVQSGTITLTVAAVRDDGVADVRIRFSDLKLSADTPDGAQQFDSAAPAQPADKAPEAGADEAASEPSLLSALGNALASAPMSCSIAPDGTVRGLNGYESVIAVLGKAPAEERWLSGMFMPDALILAIEQLVAVEGATGPRKPGDGWQTTQRTGLGSAGALEVTTDWRLDSIENGIAKIVGEESLDLLVPQQADQSSPRVQLGESSGSSEIAWSVADGALISLRQEQKAATTWSLGELSVEQQQVTTFRLERKP